MDHPGRPALTKTKRAPAKKRPAKKRPAKKRPAKKRSFWPCTLIDQGDDWSIVLGDDLHLVGHHFGERDAGGHAVQGLVKKLARAQDASLLRRVTFDSEASMFCAYGTDLDALHAIATLLADATGTTEAATAKGKRRPLSEAAAKEARACLLAGFVHGLDAAAQQRFFALVPSPPVDRMVRAWLDALGTKDAKARFTAARSLNRYAGGKTWSWDSAVGDPRVVAEILARLDAERDVKVITELMRVATRVAGRHLADLRFRPVFERALSHASADVRAEAIAGVRGLAAFDWELLLPLLDDRAPAVREAAIGAMVWSNVPSGSTSEGFSFRSPLSDRAYRAVVGALAHADGAVRAAAARVIAGFDADDAMNLVERAAKREKDAKTRARMKETIDGMKAQAPYRPCVKSSYLELYRFERLRTPGLDGPDVERAVRAGDPALIARTQLKSLPGYFVAWGDPTAYPGIAAIIRAL